MKMEHLVEEADPGQEHEQQRHQDTRVVPNELVLCELPSDVDHLETQGEVRSADEQLRLLHGHLAAKTKARGRFY